MKNESSTNACIVNDVKLPVMRSVLEDLRSKLERSRQLTQSFNYSEARWRDGMENGLETAIELLEDALTKHFSQRFADMSSCSFDEQIKFDTSDEQLLISDIMSSKIVRAKDIDSGKVRLFLEYKTDSETTYRNFKHRVRKWGRKYGAYNTVKQEAGEAHFYDGGKLKYNVEVLEVVEELDHRYVGVGYGSADVGF